jgi:hypothetical protein
MMRTRYQLVAARSSFAKSAIIALKPSSLATFRRLQLSPRRVKNWSMRGLSRREK